MSIGRGLAWFISPLPTFHNLKNMILQTSPGDITSAVDAVNKMSNLISEQSAMVVAMAILFIGFIVMFLNMIRDNRKSDSFNREYLGQMVELRNTLIDQGNLLQSHTQLLKTLVEGVSDEISSRQVDDLSDMFFAKSQLRVINYLEQIIMDNHIDNRENVEKKVEMLSSNVISYDRERALSFKFKRSPLSFFIPTEWKERLKDTMLKQIYCEDGYQYRVAKNNIEILYKQFRSEFIDNIYKNAARS